MLTMSALQWRYVYIVNQTGEMTTITKLRQAKSVT